MCPMYSYFCMDCDYQFEQVMKIDERSDPMGEGMCPKCETGNVARRPDGINIISGTNHSHKVPTDFKEHINRMKKANPGMRSEIV